MGDFIFLFFLAARMRTLDERLRGLGIWCGLEWDGRRTLQGRLAGPLPPGGEEVGAAGVALLDISFADDCVLLLTHSDPETLLLHTCAATGEAAGVFAEWGGELNFGEGKTECLLALRGTGASCLRRRTMVEDARELSCRRPDGLPFQLRVCFQYKHMGGIVDANGTMLPEIQHRAGIVGATARKLANESWQTPRSAGALGPPSARPSPAPSSGTTRSPGSHLGGVPPEPSTRPACVSTATSRTSAVSRSTSTTTGQYWRAAPSTPLRNTLPLPGFACFPGS